MAGLRKVVLKILIPALVLIIIVMWACLPFYWGSRKSTLRPPGRPSQMPMEASSRPVDLREDETCEKGS